MSCISDEELTELWDVAIDEGDDVVLRLIREIEFLRDSNGKLNSRYKRYQDHQKLDLHRTNKSRLRRGQEYMRDRAILALLDEGLVDAAVVVNNQAIGRNTTWVDIKEEHHSNAEKVEKVRHVLSEAWHRMNERNYSSVG